MANDSFGRGLIVKNGEHIIYTDRTEFKGMYMMSLGESIENRHRLTLLSESIGWFVNSNGKQLFYSSELAGNRLCVLSLDSSCEEVLLDEPCYGIKLYGNWIYYINENTSSLCKIQQDGRNNKVLVKRDVSAFVIMEDVIYYSTASEIIKMSIDGIAGTEQCVLNVQATGLAQVDQELFFADRSDRYTLCRYNLISHELHRFEDISTIDICTDASYLYCTNLNDDKSIYRVGTRELSPVRICSQSAFGLYRIEEDLWFYNLNDQTSLYRMPSEGGQAVKMRTQSGA